MYFSAFDLFAAAMDHPVIQHNDGIGEAYCFWSPSWNIHFGYWRWGVNPFRLESMLTALNGEVGKCLGLTGVEPATVVDAGCGAGATLRYLAEQYPSVTGIGVSLSVSLLDIGRKLNETNSLCGRITLLEGDFCHIPLPGASADAAFCIESACYANGASKSDLLSELARVVKPGGRVVIADAFLRVEAPKPRWFEGLCNKTAHQWAVEALPVLHRVTERLVATGFEKITVREITWRTLPSALHIPRVVLQLLWASIAKRTENREGRRKYARALLSTLVAGVAGWWIGYFIVVAERKH